MKTLSRPLLSAVLLATLLIASAVPSTVFAQSHTADCHYSASPVAITAHLESMLRARDEATRIAALQDINLLAHSKHHNFQSLHLNAGVTSGKFEGDLTLLSPSLLQAFQAERNPSARVMAANALYMIGDEKSMERLIDLNAAESSPRVKKHTNKVLATYFTTQYPELSGKKKISAASINKARRVKARAS